MTGTARRVLVSCLALMACAVASCATDTAEPGSVTSSSEPVPSTQTTAPEVDGDAIDGKFDVGGHSLYLNCQGTQPPTIVYMHGSIKETSDDPHRNGGYFLTALAGEHRVCVYDRRNLSHSDTVDAPQLPQDAIRDMHELLAAAEVPPPYVLLGASFGGLLSYLYANTYPDDVVGMVLLDSMFPDELSLDNLFKPEDTYKAYDAEDENESLERISHFKVLKAAQRYIGKEPAIPVTYLASTQEGYDQNSYGIPEYDRKILAAQEAYVDRFAPGKLLRVDSPHFMEPAIPEEIVKQLRDVVAAASL